MLNKRNLKKECIEIFKKNNKLQIVHLQTYDCKAYVMIKNTQLK